MKRPFLFCYLLVTFLTTCVEPYDPPVEAQGASFLVIDAFLDIAGSAEVSLTHTLPLDSNGAPPPEENANVVITDDLGAAYRLSEIGNGMYRITEAGFSIERKYVLTITTQREKVYQSDVVSPQSAASIDSLYWTVSDQMLEINLDTHDPASSGGKYYRWRSVETFEYNSIYPAAYYLKDHVVYQRAPDESMDLCWKTQQVHELQIGKTTQLEVNRISKQILRFIPAHDVRLTRKYSLHVLQQALTPEAYEYWRSVKETTETLGGLFDPMPGAVVGNLRSLSDPDEPVIGYFSSGTVSEKRIFISRFDLPEELVRYYNPDCHIDTVGIFDLEHTADINGIISPTYFIVAGSPPILNGYTYSTDYCTDCRVFLGGTLTKPEFWE